MRTFKEASDQYLLNLYRSPNSFTTLGELYDFMAGQLLDAGYVGATPGKVRNRIKRVLHQNRLIPRRPTLADYHRARQSPGSHPDDLN